MGRGRRTAVELVGLGVLGGLLVGGVGSWVDEAAGLAVLARQKDVGGVDEEGRCGDEENVAVAGVFGQTLACLLTIGNEGSCCYVPVLIGDLERERHGGGLPVDGLLTWLLV